jgi:hypothetical protein
MNHAISLAAMVCLAGCSAGAGTSTSASSGGASNAPSDPRIAEESNGAASEAGNLHPVIGQLRTRDRRVTLFAAHDGLRVSIDDESGTSLIQDVPIDALRDKDPALYELCRSSVASNRYYLDARLDLPLRRTLH